MKKIFENKEDARAFLMQYLKKFVLTLAVNSFTVFTALFFSPLEIFLGNIIDFYFSLRGLWWVLLAVSAAISLFASAAEALLPRKPLNIINCAAFALGMCFYLQSMFLNGGMTSMTQRAEAFPTKLVVGNLAVWAAVFALVFTLFFLYSRRKKEQPFAKVVAMISAAVILMQLTGLISLAAGVDPSSESLKNIFLSSSGSLDLSDENNVLYFVLDTCDNRYVNALLDREPELLDDFTGFTNYTNAVSTYSRTYPAVPYMLTDEECYFNLPYADYINSAYESGSFIPDMDSLGTDIRIYTDTQYVGHSVFDKVDNCLPCEGNVEISPLRFLKQSVKVSFYKNMPYALKDKFEYTAQEVNSSVMYFEEQSSWARDYDTYVELTGSGINVCPGSPQTFRFYHFMGSHPSPIINENVELTSGAEPVDALRGDFRILQEYIRQLKEAGIYDKTTIIITADHGKTAAAEYYRRVDAAPCIMLYKPAGADSTQPIRTSAAPVAHEDIFATVINALGGDGSAYGSAFEDISETGERSRLYYFLAMETDGDTEIALREYSIEGDANDFENWKLTGRNWKVLYSERAVSSMELTDVEDVQMSAAPEEYVPAE